jgi:hypothetical protein
MTVGEPAQCTPYPKSELTSGRFDATLCALAKGNPGWITSKVKFDGDVTELSSATFTVFAPTTFQAFTEVVSRSDAIGKKNDNNDDKAAWSVDPETSLVIYQQY